MGDCALSPTTLDQGQVDLLAAATLLRDNIPAIRRVLDQLDRAISDLVVAAYTDGSWPDQWLELADIARDFAHLCHAQATIHTAESTGS
jgi:hypothetical protein